MSKEHLETDALNSSTTTGNAAPSLRAKTPQYVVGIGASAGGLESLEKLFQSLPLNIGMAFVVIQHLSPDFKSMMDELLARDTEMPIHRAEDGMEVHADQIYLLPPRKEIIIAAGCLHLSDKDPSKGLTLPIDRFFESLARECRDQAVGIILSGSGSDGSRGVVEIARAGGLVICESPLTAKFDGMPLSAQATGTVDVIVPPEQIGATLVKHRNNPLVIKEERGSGPAREGRVAPQGIEAIYELFRDEYDLDFSNYKDTTVLRRINRRLSLSETKNVDEYVERLRTDRSELNALYEDLLIGVTQFFRDKDAFDCLSQTLLPRMIADRDPSRTIRAWVAGCATGEEAYSVAILLHEAMEYARRPIQLKIFATDVHKSSLDFASRGIYHSDAIRHVSAARLQRFFVRKGNAYQISQDVRETIVFAPHNVLRDAPFTDLDLVTCRNMLIYFQSPAQQKCISMFHFGLNKGGLLFLGSSETPGELARDFETLDEHNKVFCKWTDAKHLSEVRIPYRGHPIQKLPAALRSFSRQPKFPDPTLLSSYDQLLNRFMPPSLLIDENRELVDTFGGAEAVLSMQARRPSLDVLDLLDSEIRTTVAGALQRVMKDGSQVRFSGVRMRTPRGEESFNLIVEGLRNPSANSVRYLLSFESLGTAPALPANYEQAPDTSQASRDHLHQVEDELRYTKENLQATIEELETSNEELQATNEELVASNEELQSTNEELHSVNEELYTVNAEHQKKISELAELNQDMNHILENTDVATIFLDKDLRVRKFTSRVRDIFDLLEQDLGRPISSFSHRIQFHELYQMLDRVLSNKVAFETDVTATDGTSYLIRILPYWVNSEVDGVVLTLVDVSALEELRGRLRWMSAIVESTEDAIIGGDLSGNITSWNSGAERLYGYRTEEVLGKHISLLVPEDRVHEIQGHLERIHRGERVKTIETVRKTCKGELLHVSLTISPVLNKQGRVVGTSKIARDITERIAADLEIRRQIQQREHFLAMLSHELRNPLGAVLSASRLMRDERSSPETIMLAAETVDRQAQRIGSLLDDLLDVARISQGKIELQRDLVQLSNLVDDVRETTAPVLAKHESRLIMDCQDQSLWVEGDKSRLVQILVNLIHNAAKYSPRGSPIETMFRRNNGWAEISVLDHGVGISSEFLPKIFEPFVQSDETLHRSDGGLGVGLTLVKSLVELHGGRVEAHSSGRNQGSEFLVYLPLTTKPVPPTDILRRDESRHKPSRCSIVLVEDLEDNRQMMESLLALEGHHVTTASNGEEGYQMIRELRPDLALVDIGLPGIDGYEVAQRIRQDESYANVVLVALTGYGRQSDIDQALKAGFDAHLVKPVSETAISSIISVRFGCRGAEDQNQLANLTDDRTV